MNHYRAYGRVIASERPLPELEPLQTPLAPEITVTWSARLAPVAASWTTLWRFSTGEPWVTAARVDGVRYLRFGRFADCAISPNVIDVARRGHAAGATLRHLVLDQALPLALAARGAIVLHAAALTAGDRAIALAGEAGAGKSTLAALLASQGMQVLADDGVLLEGTARHTRLVPSYAGLRLYRDSAAAAGLDAGAFTGVAEYTRKLRLLPAGHLNTVAAHSRPLAAIYTLSPRQGRVTLERLSRRDAVMEVLAHAYRIDPGDRAALTAQLDRVLDIEPAVWRLSYAHDFTQAAAVASAIAAHSAALP